MNRRKKDDKTEEAEARVVKLSKSTIDGAALARRSEAFANATTKGPGKAQTYGALPKKKDS